MAKLWDGRVHLKISDSARTLELNYDKSANSMMIQFNSPFSSDNTPSVTRVSIYNITGNSKAMIKKGAHVVLSAGYAGDLGVIAEGNINYVYPRTSAGSGDIVSSFTFVEGVDYSKKKDIKLELGRGVSAQTVIRRIAAKADIKISTLYLVKSKTYKKGYSVDGNPMDAIVDVAEAAGSKVFYKRGKLIIDDVRRGKDTNLVLSSDTGLIGYPEPLDYDPSADKGIDNAPGFSIESLLQHRITVGTAIRLDSRYTDSVFHVRSGEHSHDGSQFRTTGEVV